MKAANKSKKRWRERWYVRHPGYTHTSWSKERRLKKAKKVK